MGRHPVDTRVVHTPDGGRLDAEEAVAALQSQAARGGGELLLDTEVDAIRVRPDDRVEVSTRDEVYVADTVVVTAGAWTDKLVGASVALPTLVVTQEQPAHFAVSDPAAAWPGFNHVPEPGHARYDYWYSQIYGTLTPGEGVKAGWHAVGPVTDPDARSFEPEPGQLAALQRYAREWLPGVDAETLTAISCTYTSTADTDFVLDRLGPVVVGAGFSGHGFKFVPTVGRVLADLVEGTGRPDPRFSATRPRDRRNDGAVLCHECYAEPAAMPDCPDCAGTGRATRMPLCDDPWNQVVPGLFMGGHDVRASPRRPASSVTSSTWS